MLRIVSTLGKRCLVCSDEVIFEVLQKSIFQGTRTECEAFIKKSEAKHA